MMIFIKNDEKTIFKHYKQPYYRTILKSFFLPKIIKEADLIISLPKLKTHQLAKFTGAIKNLYGCITGGTKQKYHKKAQGSKKHGKLLVDIYQNIRPELNIMDAVIGMEGDGPTSGDARKVGYLLASKNAVNLDLVSAKMIGYKPKSIYTNKEALKRKLARKKSKIVGEKLPKFKFKKPCKDKKFRAAFKNLIKERPIVCDTKKCIRCGKCARSCPAKAISMKPYPVVDTKKCIRCFCCIEICPQNAMMLGKC